MRRFYLALLLLTLASLPVSPATAAISPPTGKPWATAF